MSKAKSQPSEFDETPEESLEALVDEYPEGSTVHELATKYLAKYQDDSEEGDDA
ncbi:hypothetical protein [Haloferax volcanii]|uniref:hypothetical protein n=1 Tax=Haloferax volcanii TaxID=2246 RepID=UPI00249B739A|nr:hypothetical protein [Haloferax alexandrinus]